MDQSRYRDKAYLVTYELTVDIFEEYDIKVDDILPIRSVYMLYTDRGVKIFKKINYSVSELEFINNVVNHIIDNGYKYVVEFMKTVGGDYYIEREDGIYAALNLVEGREADYQNPLDVSRVAKALCSLHKSSRGIEGVIESRDNLYKWIPKFKKRGQELLKFKEISELHEIKSDFDNLFLKYVDGYYQQALEAVEFLESSSYEKLCDEIKSRGDICHHDLAYHNILIDNDNNVNFVDFDYCIQDLKIHDIGNLMAKSIKYCNWDIEKAEMILESYSSVEPLRKEELEVLYGFLMFPQDFYEISRQYYIKTKNWDEEEFLSRLDRKAGYWEDRNLFLEDFKNIIKMGV